MNLWLVSKAYCSFIHMLEIEGGILAVEQTY